MRHANVAPAGTMHIGLVANDLWLAEHDTPLASIRKGNSEGVMGRLVAYPSITERRRRIEHRSIMPFDVFMIAAGAYDARYYQRSKARRDAIELRERFGLSGLI